MNHVHRGAMLATVLALWNERCSTAILRAGRSAHPTAARALVDSKPIDRLPTRSAAPRADMRSSVQRHRQQLARRVIAATNVERPMTAAKGCAFPYLVQPTVALTCATSLQAIGRMLNDREHSISTETLEAVRMLISDGASPFFDGDECRASAAAVNLRQLVTSGRHEQIPGFLDARQRSQSLP